MWPQSEVSGSVCQQRLSLTHRPPSSGLHPLTLLSWQEVCAGREGGSFKGQGPRRGTWAVLRLLQVPSPSCGVSPSAQASRGAPSAGPCHRDLIRSRLGCHQPVPLSPGASIARSETYSKAVLPACDALSGQVALTAPLTPYLRPCVPLVVTSTAVPCKLSPLGPSLPPFFPSGLHSGSPP